MKHVIILFLFFSSVVFSQNYYPLDQAPVTDTEAPTAPSNLASSNITQTTVNLTWTASSDNVGVANYRVYNSGTLIATVGSAATSYTLTGLLPDTTYSLTVRGVDFANNESSNSNTVSVTTDADIVVTSSLPLYRVNASGATIVDNTSALVDWEADEGSGSNTGINYSVNRGSFTATDVSVLTRDASIPSYIDSDTFDAIFTNTKQNRDANNQMEYQFFPVTNGDYAVNIYMVNTNFKTDGIGDALFEIFIEGTEVGTNLDLISLFGHEVGGMLTYNTTVTDGVLNVAFSPRDPEFVLVSAIEILDLNVPADTTAPTNTSNLTASEIGYDYATLTWTAATDNTGVTINRIYNNGVLIDTALDVSSYTLTNLTPETAYNITIVTSDAYGNASSVSNIASFSTIAVPASLTYTLTESKDVSVGVYDVNDNLLQELEANVAKTAGTYAVPYWDGIDLYGNLNKAAGDHYKIVANAITDEWEGVIGNTSTSFSGPTVHKEYHFYREMLIEGSRMYFASGYTEANPFIVAAELSDMGSKLNVTEKDYIQNADRIATDGVTMYSAGSISSSQGTDGTTFLQALPLSSLTVAKVDSNTQDDDYFTWQGATVSNNLNGTYRATDIVSPGLGQSTDYVTGLAVQVNGDNIVTARETYNLLNVLHKTTGIQRQSYTSFLAPKLCKMDGNDNLWFVHDVGGVETIEKFTVNATTGALTTTGFTITSNNNIQAIAFNADYSIIAVADIEANGDHRIHAYNTTTGVENWVLGREENYVDNPFVYDDKFLFKDKWNLSTPFYSALAFEPDGSLWVIDGGNKRWLKFDPSRNLESTNMWLNASLSCQVDPNNITNVYSEHLEFEVDYSLPMQPTNANESWRLIKNFVETSTSNGATKGIADITTLSNGKTYGIGEHLTVNDRKIIVELTDTGYRDTGVEVDRVLNVNMKADGSLYFKNPYEGGGIQSILKQTLTGFDGSDNPIYTTKTEILRLPPETPLLSGSPGRELLGEFLSDNRMIMFQGFKKGAGAYHLGALKPNDNTEYSFLTAKEVVYPQGSEFPLDGTFDGRESVLRPASRAMVIDDLIIWNYFGEFWQNSQTNMFHVVNRYGLPLKVFGYADPKASNTGQAEAGHAGNAHNPRVVKVGNDIYIWHNDASRHGGIHRWKVSNLSSIQEFTIDID